MMEIPFSFNVGDVVEVMSSRYYQKKPGIIVGRKHDKGFNTYHVKFPALELPVYYTASALKICRLPTRVKVRLQEIKGVTIESRAFRVRMRPTSTASRAINSLWPKRI